MGFLSFLRTNWNWLTAGFLLAFTSSYGQTFFISIFAGEIMAEFSLSHTQWGMAYTLGTMISAGLMLWAGKLTDRFRVRVLGPIVFSGLALSCLAMAGNKAAWAIPLIILALRFTGQGMCSQLASVSMARWFSSNRGRALAIASLGFSIGTAFLPYVFVLAKDQVGWRMLWGVAACMALLAIVPLLILLRTERTPHHISQSNDVAGMGGRHWTRGEMLRHPLFWFIFLAIFGPAAWSTALFFQQVHLTEVKGWSHQDFVAILPLFTVVSVSFTFASGWAIDRFGAGPITVLWGIPTVVGFALISTSVTVGQATFAMCFLAISAGAGATVPGAFAAEYYGTRNLGGIKAIWAAAMVFGSAVGPGLSGWLIDHGIAFPTQSMWIAGYFVLSSLLVLVGVSRYPLTQAA